MNLTIEKNQFGLVPTKKIRIVERELVRIEKANGVLLPETIVEAAVPKAAVLHPFFTWDNSKASHLYRLWEARKLIHSVRVVYTGSKEPLRVRAFLHISNDDDYGYMSTARIMADEDLRDEVVQRARRELIVWRNRYATLDAFAKVFEAIDETVQ